MRFTSLTFIFALSLSPLFAANSTKSANEYYSDAAFQYIQNRLPSAEITCNEGLSHYPNNQKLQMLLDRINEAKQEQKDENSKNDKQNNDENSQNKDEQNNEQNNQDNQNNSSDSENSSSSTAQSSNSNENSQNEQSGANSSDSENNPNSSDSSNNQEPEQPEVTPSDSSALDSMPPGQISPAEAEQLLKDFDEQNGERKPWKPVRGQARPAKDW